MLALQSLTIISALLLSSASAAFNAKLDSCAPVDGTYKGVLSPQYFACKLSDATVRYAIHDCGERGKIWYDYLDNKIRIVAASRPVDGEFTIHGSCQRDGKEIMHLDLYTPVKARTPAERTLPGFSKLCNIKFAGVRHYFHAYALTLAELNQCGAHPVKPIS